MRAIRKLLAVVYLVAAATVLGLFACSLARVPLGRIDGLLELPGVRVALLALAALVGVGVLATVVATLAERPEPAGVRVGGNPDIEVSLDALTSAARRAAAEGEDVLIESVEGRVAGRDGAEVRLTIEAIAFTEAGLDRVARRMQQRVVEACEGMLGVPGVRARVRFLPSKTTIVTKEV